MAKIATKKIEKEEAKDYVLVLCLRYSDFKDELQVLLVLKNRPLWMCDKLNLPGGAVEPNEKPEDAAKRELLEETGIEAYAVNLMGVMKDRLFTIYCYNSYAKTHEELKPRPQETEKVMWVPYHVALKDKRLLPNLRVIIPLIRSEVRNWIIEDTACSNYGAMHTISVTVPTFVET